MKYDDIINKINWDKVCEEVFSLHGSLHHFFIDGSILHVNDRGQELLVISIHTIKEGKVGFCIPFYWINGDKWIMNITKNKKYGVEFCKQKGKDKPDVNFSRECLSMGVTTKAHEDIIEVIQGPKNIGLDIDKTCKYHRVGFDGDIGGDNYYYCNCYYLLQTTELIHCEECGNYWCDDCAKGEEIIECITEKHEMKRLICTCKQKYTYGYEKP